MRQTAVERQSLCVFDKFHIFITYKKGAFLRSFVLINFKFGVLENRVVEKLCRRDPKSANDQQNCF